MSQTALDAIAFRLGGEYRDSSIPDRTSPGATRDRKRRGYRLRALRGLTEIEIEKLAARGYAMEPGFALSAVLEAFVSDSLADD